MFTHEDGVLNEEPLVINLNTRTITVPSSVINCAGVQTDRMAEMLIFEVDRFFDYMDLANSKITIYVQWETPEGKDAHGNIIPAAAGSTQVDFMDYITKPGKILFAWPLTADIAKAAGAVKFSVRFFKLDDISNQIVYSLNTQSATIGIKPALLSPDVKPNVLTPLLTNMFESVILNSDAADGVRVPFSPWFAFPGNDISLLSGNTVSALNKVDSHYIANLQDNTLTFCAQAVTSDLAEINYEWTYIPADAQSADKVQVFEDEPVYLFAGTEDYFSGERKDENDNIIAVNPPAENKRLYEAVTNSRGEITGYTIYGGDYPIGGDISLYERYASHTIPAGTDEVTGYYFVTAVGAFDGVASEPRDSSRCELPGPQPIEIQTDLPLSHYLQVVEDDKIVDRAVTLQVDTGANPYFATMGYTWESSVDNKTYTEITNNTNTLSVENPGWYRVTVDSILNRKAATPVKSNTCFVTNLPVVPNIQNATAAGNIVNLTRAANSTVLKAQASLPSGYEIDNPLHHEKFNYKWYISLVNEGNPHLVTEADKDYAVANGSELTVYWNDKIDYASFDCRVENELNGKIATSNFMGTIFVDYQ